MDSIRFDSIRFEGKNYISRNIIFSFGERLISSLKLNESLMSEDGNYRSEKARLIDEKIFYFVDENILRLQDNEIVQIILSEI